MTAEGKHPKTNERQPQKEHSLDQRIKFVKGDLTEVVADAIVCPSLPDLDVMYTGVAGAIMRKGGDIIFAEARAIGEQARKQNPQNEFPVPLMSAHITHGGNLPRAKHVIHSVAVNFTEEGLSCDPETVFQSAWNVLDVADVNKLRSVAFPGLGAGLYQVPLDESLGAIARAADKFLGEHPNTTLENIMLVYLDLNFPKPSLIEEVVADRFQRNRRDKSN